MSNEKFMESISKLEENLKLAGDAYELVNLLGQAMVVRPEILERVLRGNVEVASQMLDQTRTDYGAIVYPVEIAIRHLANKINYFGGEKDPLSPKSWTIGELVGFLENYGSEVSYLAGTHNISVNLPHRSAHIFEQLHLLGLRDEPLFFIELGTSGGFLLSGLLHPDRYKVWANDQVNFCKLDSAWWSKSIFDRDSNSGFGVDLSLPERGWVISCVGDDLARTEMREFIKRVGMSSELYKMNALDVFHEGELTIGDMPSDHRPIVVSCAMLYQLDMQTRVELESRVLSFIKPRNGLFVVTNQARFEGFPDKREGSVSYVKDGSGKVISPVWHMNGNKMLNWVDKSGDN